jgi:hypothetical protein
MLFPNELFGVGFATAVVGGGEAAFDFAVFADVGVNTGSGRTIV